MHFNSNSSCIFNASCMLHYTIDHFQTAATTAGGAFRPTDQKVARCLNKLQQRLPAALFGRPTRRLCDVPDACFYLCLFEACVCVTGCSHVVMSLGPLISPFACRISIYGHGPDCSNDCWRRSSARCLHLSIIYLYYYYYYHYYYYTITIITK